MSFIKSPPALTGKDCTRITFECVRGLLYVNLSIVLMCCTYTESRANVFKTKSFEAYSYVFLANWRHENVVVVRNNVHALCETLVGLNAAGPKF